MLPCQHHRARPSSCRCPSCFSLIFLVCPRPPFSCLSTFLPFYLSTIGSSHFPYQPNSRPPLHQHNRRRSPKCLYGVQYKHGVSHASHASHPHPRHLLYPKFCFVAKRLFFASCPYDKLTYLPILLKTLSRAMDGSSTPQSRLGVLQTAVS
jgi:hypothetical protein